MDNENLENNEIKSENNEIKSENLSENQLADDERSGANIEPIEGDSSDGSDIFMPGGITLKSNQFETTSEGEKTAHLDESTCNIDQKKEEEFTVEEKAVDVNEKTGANCNNQTSDNVDIGMKDDANVLPDQDRNDKLNPLFPLDTTDQCKEQVDENNFKEMNIFSNPDIFAQCGSETNKADDCKYPIKEEEKSGNQSDTCDDLEPLAFDSTETNVYLIDKEKSRSSKEVRRMLCECPFEPDDPFFVGCDENCLNRLLMIECNNRCPAADFCTNRNFQKGCQYNLVIFKAGKKGWGLKSLDPISKGSFVIEYCGEVVNYSEFHHRTMLYNTEGMQHYYFMTLKTNEIIDATKKGSKSRFINHSCDPNCVTQKWTVNGFLRVGFFALRHIEAGEELSFDYQFQRYGEKPQECYCSSPNCRRVIGTEQSGLPSQIEKIMSVSSSNLSKSKRRKNQIKEFLDSALAGELNELLGSSWELKDSNQALEVIRLMVKVETLHERRELLKILQATQDVSSLKAFVRYKGLSLLWTWMVDAPKHKNKYKVEILKALKHLPIPNKNELDDSKVMHIVSKWSKMSITEIPDDDEPSGGSENELKIDECGGGSTSDSPGDDTNHDDEITKNGNAVELESTEEGEIFDPEDEIPVKKNKKKSKKKAEHDNDRKKEMTYLASSLLDDWKSLKEVFRIPKRTQTPERRELEDKRPKKHMDLSPGPYNTCPVTSTKEIHPDSTCLSPNWNQPEASNAVHCDEDYDRQWIENSRPASRKNVSKHSDTKRDRGSFKRNSYSRYDCDSTNNESENNWNRNVDRRARSYRRYSGDDNRRGWRERGNWNNNNWTKQPDDWGHKRWNENYKNPPVNNNNVSWENEPWSNHENNYQPNFQSHTQVNTDPMLTYNNHLPNPNHRSILPPPQDPSILPMSHNMMSTHPRIPHPPLPMIQPAPMLPNQRNSPMLPIQHNAPLPMANPPPFNNNQQQNNTNYAFNKPLFDAPVTPDVTALNVVNQLQILLNAERMKHQGGSKQGSPVHSRSSLSPRRIGSPPTSRSKLVLPPHWKTATDAEGRVYYYHTITRETSWDPPVGKSSSEVRDVKAESPPSKRHRKRGHADVTPTPPSKFSPRIAAADTTHHHGPRTPPDPRVSKSSTTNVAKIRETFKCKLTSVVVSCLNGYQKVDCKQGRIKSSDDFKFLARKLTHGLIMKEIQRIKKEELLVCNDSVKMKVKDYIRNYMKKFGAYYVRS